MNEEQKLGTAAFEEQLRQTSDARVWAQTFMLLTADVEIDEGLMIGWFANAIEWAKLHEQKRLRLAGIDLDHTYEVQAWWDGTIGADGSLTGVTEGSEGDPKWFTIPLFVRRPLGENQ